MSNIVYIATSLDGFIAREDGNVDWLIGTPNPDNSDFGFSEFMENIDAIVMGKNSFEMVLSFGEWPYRKPVFVLSNSLHKIPDNLIGKAEILNGNPLSIIKELNSRQFFNLYVDGGKVIQDFLELGLIDEMIITKIPIVLGSGIPLFTKVSSEQKFKHVKTEVFQNSLVKSHYKKQ